MLLFVGLIEFLFYYLDTKYRPKSRTQIDQLPVKPGYELMEDKIDGIQTYHIYQTNASMLRFAKEDLEKMIRI